jgi:hypothetical protein
MGLPEKPMKHLVVRDSRFGFDPEAEPMVPAMALGVEECCRRGMIVKYVKKLTLDGVVFEGIRGEPLETAEVEEAEILSLSQR